MHASTTRPGCFAPFEARRHAAAQAPPPAALRDARRRPSRSRCVPRAAAASAADTSAARGAALPAVLAAAHAASLVALPPCARGERFLSGGGEALGLATRWHLRVSDASGSFAETVELLPPASLIAAEPVATLRAGFDATTAWQTELASGAVSALAPGDDARDRSLLFAWLRSGAWTAAVASGALHAQLLPEQAAPDGTAPCHVLSLSLAGSPDLACRVWLPAAPTPCLPLRVELQTSCAGAESWTFASWPDRATHTQPTGEEAVFTADGLLADKNATPLAALAAMPVEAPAPPFEATPVAAARCAGGQFLLRAALSPGGAPAWWALDTACDGAAVTAAAADAAGMPSMGRAAVAGLGGALTGALRRGGLAVGDVELLPPASLQLQLSLDGALAPPDGGALGGVLGCAALRRATLELHSPRRAPGARAAPVLTATLHAPGVYQPPDRLAVAWRALTFIDGVPHVRASYSLQPGAPLREGLFRLALGVGGCGVILSNSEAAAVGFASATAALAPVGTLTAPGEGRARMAAVEEGSLLSGRLDALQLGGATFRHVRALAHTAADPSDLNLSHRAAGALCADLFRGVHLVLDFAAGRYACINLDRPLDDDEM